MYKLLNQTSKNSHSQRYLDRLPTKWATGSCLHPMLDAMPMKMMMKMTGKCHNDIIFVVCVEANGASTITGIDR